MYKDIFTQLGLSPNEAIIYEFLLKNGELPAGLIIKKTPLKRGVTYNALKSLEQKGLIYTKAKDKISIFGPNHPDKLREFAEERENELQKAEKTLSANMPKLISSFNLISGQPGVRIYEGKEGIIKTLNDSLESQTEILTYADVEGMEQYLKKGNDEYVKKRKEMGIKKRGIVADTSYAREYLKDYDRSVTEIRLIDGKKFPMFLEMEIYDNKVSFMTFSQKKLIGVILENEEIYKTQKSIFEIVWNNASPLEKIIEPKPSRFEAPSPEAK
jgi:HTH-type transcriptional regulator, sugar sensing transcriptional regulator